MLDVFIEPNLPPAALDIGAQGAAEIATAKFTTARDGRRYYYCCAHCLRTFEKAHVA